MKLLAKTSFVTLIFSLPFLSVGQRPIVDDDPNHPPQIQTPQFDCSIMQNGAGCNYIRNNSFSWQCYNCDGSEIANPCYPGDFPNTWPGILMVSYPFNSCLIPEWREACGSPQITNPNMWNSVNSPVPGTYAALMWIATFNLGDMAGENLVQQIKQLQNGHKYQLSFFKDAIVGNGYSLENFEIVLLHCQDYADHINGPGVNAGYGVPAIPQNSQIIFCQRNLTDPDWQRNIVTFTANSNYDMFWVRPHTDPSVGNLANIWFAYPELLDVTNFSAGLPPIVNYPNCNVQIGPRTPNCGPLDAIFYWTGPQGQIIPVTSSNQQINVNAATQYGTWTLHMVVPPVSPSASNVATVTTNNNCSTNTNDVTATVLVSACNANTWYKVYNGDKYTHVTRGSNGNIYMNLVLHDITPNINHVGVTPTPPFYDEFTLHYTTAGSTNWVKKSLYPLFVLQSGDIQMNDYNYYDGGTGNPTAGPSVVPPNEEIIAETISGSFITATYPSFPQTHYNFYIHSTSGTSTLLFNSGYFSKFNRSNNKLFLWSWPNNDFRVYDVSANVFTLIASLTMNYPIYVVQIDNNDFVYVLINGVLNKFDYTNNSYTPVAIAGFTNNNLISFVSDSHIGTNGPYTSDQCLVGQTVEENIYALNFASMTERKAHTNNFLAGPNSWLAPSSTSYVANGNDIYISGTTQANITIANTLIPSLGTDFSNFIVKLNLQTDFVLRTIKNVTSETEIPKNNLFAASLFPNPAKTMVRVSINENALPHEQYKISIYNSNGQLVLYKETKQDEVNLNISPFKAGAYYLVITNENGQKITKSFIKQ